MACMERAIAVPALFHTVMGGYRGGGEGASVERGTKCSAKSQNEACTFEFSCLQIVVKSNIVRVSMTGNVAQVATFSDFGNTSPKSRENDES